MAVPLVPRASVAWMASAPPASPLAGVTRVADHAGGTAGQHDRPVPGPLEAPQRQQRDEVPGVQARCGGVETRIDGDRSGFQLGRQRIPVGGLGNQSTPLQLVEDRRAP